MILIAPDCFFIRWLWFISVRGRMNFPLRVRRKSPVTHGRLCRPEAWRAMAACLALVLFSAEPGFTQGTARSDIDKMAIDEILRCLTSAQEAVMLPDKVECKGYQDGRKFLDKESANMPLNIDSDGACKQDSNDWRALKGDTIKVVVKRSPASIDQKGIRIIGAIYCEALDLIGLELPYSLALDKSIFRDGILGRSFRTRGDFSVDDSVIFGELYLARAHVDGTVFANKSFINKVRVLDAEVRGSLLFRDSLILELAAFDTVSLSGELSMRRALFPYLLIQFSKIGGVLDLTDSQARCSYHLRKSEVGDLVAVRAGFGKAELSSDNKDRLFSWYLHPESRAATDPYVLRSALFKAAKTDPSGKALCDHPVASFLPGSFLVSDTQVKSSVCLRQFRWLEGSKSNDQKSFITFTGVNVGATASIDLATVNSKLPAGPPDNRNLEIIGFQTGSLMFHFEDSKQNPYRLLLSGLKFEHVYAAAENPCGYDPNFSDSDSKKAEAAAAAEKKAAAAAGSGAAPDAAAGPDTKKTAGAVAAGSGGMSAIAIPRKKDDVDPGSNFRSPHVEEVMSWLNRNSLETTQPFAAFVEVFQKHGENNDAKALRIAKADIELCLKVQRVFGVLGDWICKKNVDTPSQGKENTATAQSFGLSDFFAWGADFVSVVFGAVLWLIADNGYRPEKVGWFVVLAIAAFAAYFCLVLRVVGLLPKEKRIILPMGVLFLFDRLLPAYQIRADHYHIASFFKRVPRKMRKSQDLKTKKMRYLWWDIPVVATNEVERLRVERSLDVLKIIGLVLAVFLVAAINAIVSR
jgi:hypothetical protein